MTVINLRPARAGDGQAVFDVTRASVRELARSHYSESQIAGWMDERTAQTYERLIAAGSMVVAEQDGRIVGFVDAEPGEVTRLFLLAAAAGLGLGSKLLEIGIAKARQGHDGPIRVEATLNAEGFYARHGFRPIEHGFFSHGVGGDPIGIILMEL
ncbi:MAG TPA: GNAT family N-acetyltransferase [Mesorhizobium sp.]|jgi:GNAT superfamily N-acetyltransferase|uniref:GNAT family N-acetyltransferase n=1 Tax=Mesorhizobium sp. TaxID=1871066 RepID=UPI002DDCC3F0|nr:GNAT family N-acetyltransferase [Mesorhizobium sp.]HEV2503485.1 GNAT family N-acetyltransferase [Mesorhizobium sp.]